MASIYLKHDKHGTKVAVAEAEAVYDESNGWVRYTLEKRIPSEPEVSYVQEQEPTRVKRQYTRRAA